MAATIVWTARADADLRATLDFISVQQSIEAARLFVERVFTVLDLLAEMPNLGRATGRLPGVRRIAITQHLMLYYEVRTPTECALLGFFDTRRDPATAPDNDEAG